MTNSIGKRTVLHKSLQRKASSSYWPIGQCSKYSEVKRGTVPMYPSSVADDAYSYTCAGNGTSHTWCFADGRPVDLTYCILKIDIFQYPYKLRLKNVHCDDIRLCIVTDRHVYMCTVGFYEAVKQTCVFTKEIEDITFVSNWVWICLWRIIEGEQYVSYRLILLPVNFPLNTGHITVNSWCDSVLDSYEQLFY